jgi:hypothetical protein
VPIHTTRDSLALDLRSYGEDDLAARIRTLPEADLERIFDRADHYVYGDGGGLLAKALAQSAVEVIEGAPRDLKRARRRIRGVYPGDGEQRAGIRERLAGLFPGAREEPAAPRAVFLAAAGEIAARFEPAGWRYAPSGPHLRRASGRFTTWLRFGTSTRNAPGALVVMNVSARVTSRELARWRSERPDRVRRGDGVAAGQIGNLGPRPTWLDWNLADARRRPAAITDVVARVEELALPWLDSFRDGDALADRLRGERLPCMWVGDAIEVLVWLGHRGAAEEHARLCLQAPGVADAFARELRRLDGRPPTGDEPLAHDGALLARAVVAHGLRP